MVTGAVALVRPRMLRALLTLLAVSLGGLGFGVVVLGRVPTMGWLEFIC